MKFLLVCCNLFFPPHMQPPSLSLISLRLLQDCAGVTQRPDDLRSSFRAAGPFVFSNSGPGAFLVMIKTPPKQLLVKLPHTLHRHTAM